MVLSESIVQALAALHDRLKPANVKWLVGGSCGLLLQGVPIGREPRDLDVYMDETDAIPFHHALKDLAMDAPQFSRTPIYESVLSHYAVPSVQLEAVGGFRVQACGAEYRVEIGSLLYDFGFQAEAAGRRIPLMPLAHEFLFNILRERPDRYEAIAPVIKGDLALHLPPLIAIIGRNLISAELLERMNGLLGVSLQERMAVKDAGGTFSAGR
ncbi:nucleotidyltransferase domain-containing protein [Paenibacillus sp. MBLB4367]|uniref:nucleotidyltransferase domain-containing protein n=1 Tax=Paenibacillus sp. MBLB4367 TaxID=3384767 RepID=UPI0039081F54